MDEPAPNDCDGPTLAHQLLEHLTVLKLQLGLLRNRLQSGDLAPAAIEAHLADIEQEVDAAAGVATNMRAEPREMA